MKITTAPPLPEIPWANMQYWYTMDVPMDSCSGNNCENHPTAGGVYPVQVYAPRLVARMHIEIPVDGIERPVHVPEGSLVEMLLAMLVFLGFVFLWRRAR